MSSREMNDVPGFPDFRTVMISHDRGDEATFVCPRHLAKRAYGLRLDKARGDVVYLDLDGAELGRVPFAVMPPGDWGGNGEK